jgi:hypothetical protein
MHNPLLDKKDSYQSINLEQALLYPRPGEISTFELNSASSSLPCDACL